MAKSTRQYVFDGLELLIEGLGPFVEQRLNNAFGSSWTVEIFERFPDWRPNKRGSLDWDNYRLLRVVERCWREAFGDVLGRSERSIVNELVDVRNRHAHDEKFTYDDAERALDSMRRLLDAISAGETADKVGKMRETILRTKFEELRRNEERRRTAAAEISVETVAGLLPWREVVEPHEDVATGEFQQAEFAADLAKVCNGSAPSEYSDPREFFSRTYLTDGLSTLLVGAAKRLSENGGDPIVELQTNFGGGKTHSMLALYHMVGKADAKDLPGLDQLLEENGLTVPDTINRAVLVGTSRGPQDVLTVKGGTKVRTTWGDMAWQLGGKEAHALVAENDKKGIAPGSEILEQLFKSCAPCLILIDEWVAYLRQIYKTEGLPSGTFDANLTFVQSLTEAVKASPGTLLVASLPASQIEVGGEGGQEALMRLKQTFSRVENPWRPASQEESYEIVRRRLFKAIPGDRFHHRDNTLKQYAKLYRDNQSDFPQGCSDEDYRRKLEKAYPIHPELFDRLYVDWGSIEKFQRTRGVLRLMAQVIHELWMANDPSVMIMPGSVAVSSQRIEPELMHYLHTNWQSIIAGDVDGASSTPYKIDQSAPNLNKFSATRRVARAVFMGSAPTHQEQNKGLDDKHINLGVVQPGERPATFGDALRRLSNQAKFLHSDLGRYWYSTAASLNRLASDRAGQFDDELILTTIDKHLAAYINSLADRGHFDAVQATPQSSADVPDEAGGVRAVVLGIKHPHTTGKDASDALAEAKDILLQRGSTPRVYRNMMVFLAADARNLDNLKSAVRLYLAWDEIVNDTERLDLTQSDAAMAKAKFDEAKETLATRLREAWCWLIYPSQENAQEEMELNAGKVSAQDNVLSRASKKLIGEEGLLAELGPARLDRDLQKYIWNDKPHLSLKELWEYLNRYTYLPRLKDQAVLIRTIQTAVSGTVPGPFAYAERWDEVGGTYLGLVIEATPNAQVVVDDDSVIIRPEIAEPHRPKPAEPGQPEPAGGEDNVPDQPAGDDPAPAPDPALPTRFIGTVMISPERPARDMHQIVEGVIEQLTTISGAEVSLKLEIDAEVPDGLDRGKVRTVLENANTLGFIDKEFK